MKVNKLSRVTVNQYYSKTTYKKIYDLTKMEWKYPLLPDHDGIRQYM